MKLGWMFRDAVLKSVHGVGRSRMGTESTWCGICWIAGWRSFLVISMQVGY